MASVGEVLEIPKGSEGKRPRGSGTRQSRGALGILFALFCRLLVRATARDAA